MSAISRRHFIGSAAAASALPLIGPQALAQTDWPTRPIKIIAGGKTERIQQLMKSFGVDDTAMTFEETQKLYREETPIWLEAVGSLGLAPS
jgi:hypothetical protein